MKNRFAELHTQSVYRIAERIRDMALDNEAKNGKAMVRLTQYDIAKRLGVDPQYVSWALRLTYTAEFLDLYGWGFVSPGSGRSGAIYGYTLQHDRATAASDEQHDQLRYTDKWVLDHLNGLTSHWNHLAKAHGLNTTLGKAAAQKANIVGLAAASIEALVSADTVAVTVDS